MILISTFSLASEYFFNYTAFEKINLDIFNIDFDIKKFNYVYFKTIGCLLLLNVIFLPIVSRRKLKLVRYAMLIASGICLLFSVEELLILTDFDFNSDSFLTEIILTTSSFFVYL